jgi:hypothetical protein
LITEILAQGHALANHTYTHPRATFLVRERREDPAGDRSCAETLRVTKDRPAIYFRAPVGMVNPFVHPALARRDLTLVGWSVRGLDTVKKDPCAWRRRSKRRRRQARSSCYTKDNARRAIPSSTRAAWNLRCNASPRVSIASLSRGRSNCGRAAPENEEMVVEWRAAVRRAFLARELGVVERRIDALARGEMQRHAEVPRDGLGEALARVSHPEPPGTVARAVAKHDDAIRRHPRGQLAEERLLISRRQIVNHVEECDITPELRERLRDIVIYKPDAGVTARRNASCFAHLPLIGIETDDRLLAAAFSKVKRQQADTTADIKERSTRTTQRFPYRGNTGSERSLLAT